MIKLMKVKLKDITLYEKNAKNHTPESTKKLRRSIEEFGYNAPIGVCGDNNVVVFGHGRVTALREIHPPDYEIDCVQIAGLSDEQIRELRLVENSTQMATGFDVSKLNDVLDSISAIDMGVFDIHKKLSKLPDPSDAVECPACNLIFNKNERGHYESN